MSNVTAEDLHDDERFAALYAEAVTLGPLSAADGRMLDGALRSITRAS